MDYKKGNLYTVVGKMKKGKTTYCIQELIAQLDNNVSCLYLDSEMTFVNFLARIIWAKTGIQPHIIKGGDRTPEQQKKIDKALDWLIGKQDILHFEYDPEWTDEKIEATCKKYNFEFMILDYVRDTSLEFLSSIAINYDCYILATVLTHTGENITNYITGVVTDYKLIA